MWWRRAVLPSLPWVACFLSFFLSVGFQQKQVEKNLNKTTLARGKEFYKQTPSAGVPVLVPVRASPVPSVVRGKEFSTKLPRTR